MKHNALTAMFVLTASSTLHGQQCVSIHNEAHASYDMTLCLEEPCMFEEAVGIAYVFAAGSNLPISCGNPQFSSDADINIFSGYGTTSAHASAFGFEGWSSVSLSPSCLSVSIDTINGVYISCAECGHLITGGGAAGVSINTQVDCQWSMDFVISIQIDCYQDGDPQTDPGELSASDIFYISHLDANGNPTVSVFSSRCNPATQIKCNDDGTATVTISGGPGPISFGLIPRGDLSHFDMDDDGRVNDLDVAALTNILPHTVTGPNDPLRIFDFDGNGMVASDDLSIYESLVDALNQGVAGDASGDGLTNCDDLAGVLAHQFDPAVGACNPAYRIEFDWDLDGDNDADDRLQILRAIQPADYNGDGLLTFFDISAFLDEYNNQTPDGDFNGDGLWNFFDVDAFLVQYNNPC
ncbi:MAG: GC-type dockerin domain-anchored protein [Phycisphaerales bacterium]